MLKIKRAAHKPSRRQITVNRKVAPPGRPLNSERRPREHLTPKEMERVLDAARKRGRYGQRDYALLLVMYRHGLRVGELVGLRWDDLDFRAGTLHVRRKKHGVASTHPLRGPEIRALRELRRDRIGPYVFVTERGGPMTPDGVRKIVEAAGKAAGLDFPIHPHMLRHACGYALASKGIDTRGIAHYLGHASLQSTMRYTALSPERFKDFWDD